VFSYETSPGQFVEVPATRMRRDGYNVYIVDVAAPTDISGRIWRVKNQSVTYASHLADVIRPIQPHYFLNIPNAFSFSREQVMKPAP
jgi:hypothetical protein